MNGMSSFVAVIQKWTADPCSSTQGIDLLEDGALCSIPTWLSTFVEGIVA